MTQALQKNFPAHSSVEAEGGIQYLANRRGQLTAVLVPIDQWRDIVSSLETLHLIKDEKMRRRLEESLQREESVPWEEVLRRLGVDEHELERGSRE